MSDQLIVKNVSKTFTMHLRGGIELPVLQNVTFSVAPGRCSVLIGPSGIGKSSILKMIFGNYATNDGSVRIRHHGEPVELCGASPRLVQRVRSDSVSYVSQFLRVIPRVAALDIVAAGLRSFSSEPTAARRKAADLLARLNLPEKLWNLPPATFSGGEQQRVNIARGFITDHALLLLDEPTASLDAINRAVVVELIKEKKQGGVAMLGIFHDRDVRDTVADALIDVQDFVPGNLAA